MNWKLILKVISILLFILGIAMIPAMLTSLSYGEIEEAFAFFKTAGSLCAICLCGIIFIRPESKTLHPRDGYLIVALCWILCSLIGALPFVLSGYTNSFIDAFFESCAAFTTTGATVMIVEFIPKGIMMWLAISHWLGGMGILVFAISLLPALGIAGQNIFKAESPGLQVTKMTTRISDNAKILYLMYIGLSIIEFCMLMLGGMGVFDAIINTLGSISTSGLFSHSEGLAYYDSVYVELILAIFTIFASINFSLYHLLLRGRIVDITKDIELRVFIFIILCTSTLIGLNLYFTNTYESFGDIVRYSLFQVTSFATTSGYAVIDYTVWPTFSKALLFILMFIGGCGASTCGSIKVVRIIVAVKLVLRNIYQRLHPRAVVAVKVGGKAISAPVVSQVTSFIFTFFLIFLVGSIILSLQGLDITTTVSSAIAMLSNTGLSFGAVGATSNYSVFCPALRLVLCLLMLIGRLEIFTILFLFAPSFWNHSKATS